ncbi:MAG: phosphoribosylanthranilate isomerase [Endomicrobiaceae bacterium]
MTKIKICGLFRECDIDFVNEAMPDYIGFVFAKSRRQVEEKQAHAFRQKLNSKITSVGVFVNGKEEEILNLYNNGTISVAQLHGDENDEYIKHLKDKSGIKIIKSFNLNENISIEILEKSNADFLLFDNGAGGTGKTFDWDFVPKIQKPFFLAGGLNENNIENAIKLTNPYAVDLSTGVETNGVKDREKILNIIRRVKNV